MKKSLGTKIRIIPTPVWVIGSNNEAGNPNIMTVAWGGVCCSRPPAVNISLRKATYSYHNILINRAFTVNIPSADLIREADFCGIASGRNVDKFSETKLTPVQSTIVNAPYIEEFPLIFECKLIHSIEIGLHTQFIGEILDAKVENEFSNIDGEPDIAKIQPFVYDPGSVAYYGICDMVGKAFSVGKDF